MLLAYKLYLQTLLNVKEHGNQYKDEEVLPIFEKRLISNKRSEKMNSVKNYVEIQSILLKSNINGEDFNRINDLILDIIEENENLKQQQTSFVEYLNKFIDDTNDEVCDDCYTGWNGAFKEVLNKYNNLKDSSDSKRHR